MYWVAPQSFETIVYTYGKVTNRPLVQNEINLTLKQQDHFELIRNNLKEENKYFWYHYFFNNCSTIPRDHLNTVVKGK